MSEYLGNAAPCYCGGCRTCLRDQGLSDEPEVICCDTCGKEIRYADTVEVAGDNICEACAARAELGGSI